MNSFKSNIVISDPVSIYTNAIRNHIIKRVGGACVPERSKALLKSLLDGVIKWGVECDCGEYYTFIEWNNHSKFDIPVEERNGGRLTIGDIYFLMSNIAEGLGINIISFSNKADEEIVITSLVSKDPDENGKLTAIFYFK